MQKVVGRCGNTFAVADTETNAVDWVKENQLRQAVTNGDSEVVGVPTDSDEPISVSRLYYMPWESITFGGEDSIFTCEGMEITKWHTNAVKMQTADGRVCKLRSLCAIRKGQIALLNAEGNLAEDGVEQLEADISGILCTLSNGVKTILPEDMFRKLFRGIITMRHLDFDVLND